MGDIRNASHHFPNNIPDEVAQILGAETTAEMERGADTDAAKLPSSAAAAAAPRNCGGHSGDTGNEQFGGIKRGSDQDKSLLEEGQ